MERYHRQILLPQVGSEGQERLARSRVLLVGCGALGSMIAELLVRAGVGFIRLCDRDIVELSNLQRQVLFDEADAREQLPKTIAAGRRLGQINSSVTIDPRVVDVHAGNVEELAGTESPDARVHLILDGTDNAQTRYLLNDVAVKYEIPWIYGACVGTQGRCMAIHPPHTSCLRCIFPEVPGAGELATCDTAGVLGAAVGIIASLQSAAAIALLIGADVPAELVTVELWPTRFRSISTVNAKRVNCPTCRQRRFEFLENRSEEWISLCGRDAVQVRPAKPRALDLDDLAGKLNRIGRVQRTPYLLRCELHDPKTLRLTVFPDGRAIVHGTADAARARSVYSRFIGA